MSFMADRYSKTLIAGALGLLMAMPSTANQVVGAQGAVLRTLSGSYGELFPGGSEFPADVALLALEIERDGQATRLLVPGTETYTPEFSPTLVHDGRAEVTYLLWEGLHNGIHPQLYLRSFDGLQWGEAIELSGSPFSRKGHPQLVVTRDRSMEPNAEGGVIEVERAVLHVFWWEELEDQLRKRYAPLVLEAGHFIGAHPVADLSSRILPDVDSIFQPYFGDVLKVQTGPDLGSVMALWVEQDLGKLVSVELDVAPRALSRLAESVFDFLRMQDASLPPAQLAAMVGDHIAAVGGSLHPATLEYVKRSVVSLLAAAAPGELATEGMQAAAGRVGAHILVIGRFQGIELDTSASSLGIIQATHPDGARPWHHFNATRVATFQLPVEATPASHYFVSKSGRDACVAWQVDNHVYYRESAPGGWSEPRSIDLSPTLDLATVLSILEQRTLDR